MFAWIVSLDLISPQISIYFFVCLSCIPFTRWREQYNICQMMLSVVCESIIKRYFKLLDSSSLWPTPNDWNSGGINFNWKYPVTLCCEERVFIFKRRTLQRLQKAFVTSPIEIASHPRRNLQLAVLPLYSMQWFHSPLNFLSVLVFTLYHSSVQMEVAKTSNAVVMMPIATGRSGMMAAIQKHPLFALYWQSRNISLNRVTSFKTCGFGVDPTPQRQVALSLYTCVHLASNWRKYAATRVSGHLSF